MAHIHLLHTIFNAFFLVKGIFLVVVGCIYISFDKRLGFVKAINLVVLELQREDPKASAHFFLLARFGPIAVVTGVFVVGMAMLGLDIAFNRRRITPIIAALLLIILFIFEVFYVSIVSIYFIVITLAVYICMTLLVLLSTVIVCIYNRRKDSDVAPVREDGGHNLRGVSRQTQGSQNVYV